MNIDELEAGPLMDALVAKKVFGIENPWDGRPRHYAICPDCTWKGGDVLVVDCGRHQGSPKPYSTDIAAAWEVIEKLRGEGVFFSVKSEAPILEGPCADTSKYRIQEWDREYQRYKPGIAGETAPEVICKAALKAVGYREDRKRILEPK